jgi:hypothetical protein
MRSLFLATASCRSSRIAQPYARHFAESLFMNNQEMPISKFKREIDFNSVYALQTDPILSLEDWTRIDPTTALFVNLLDGKPR